MTRMTNDPASPYMPPVPYLREGVPTAAPTGPGTAFPGTTYTGGDTGGADVDAAGRGRRRRKAKTLRPSNFHLASRFTYGVTQDVVRSVRKQGAMAWFDRQLDHENVRDPQGAELPGWWPHLSQSAQETWRKQITDEYPGWMQMRDLAGLQLTRKIRSRRQVYEVMVGFWENHLHIPNNSDAFVWRHDYGEAIRRHALGRFDEMLAEVAVHPAMLIWLDGATSTKAAPNENLGRELLELFTVGVGHYTEDDVKNAARILTGWRVDLWRTWQRSYVPENHATGSVVVGPASEQFRHGNADADGQAVTMAFLKYLAHRRDTAEHVCRRLVTKFVRDDAPESLVQQLADVYLTNDTAIKPVLRALVRSAEFKAAAGAKLRDTSEDVAAVYRCLGTRLSKPQNDQSATVTMVWETYELGLMQGNWPRPDGAPLTNASYGTPLRALASTEMHWAMAGGWWPREQIAYRAPAAWVPHFPITAKALVDHVSRAVLGRPADDTLLEAARIFLDYPDLDFRIDSPDHAVVRWQMPRLLGAVLDSPAFYYH